MELDDFPGRFKAAKLLASANAEELATRPPGRRRIHGVTTPEVAKRINQGGLAYATLRNMENGVRQPEERDIYAIAKALGLPMEFFLLTRPQLAAAIAGADVQALLDEQALGIRDDPHSRAGEPHPGTRAAGG